MSTARDPRRIAVTAPDGVEIVGAASGEGPGIAFVYGAMMEQTGWGRLLPHLQEGHALYTYDRRGRGESSDSEEYEVQFEVDDLLCFVESLPQPLDVFAHSSGALLTLRAALAGLPVRRMVLYEPLLVAVREPQLSAELPGQILSLVRQGDRHGALELFMRDGMELPASDIDRIRGGERWQEQMRYVETGAYDTMVARTYVLEPPKLAQVHVPTLLLVGSSSPAWMKRGVEAFGRALPDSRIEVLQDQGHNAQFSAPRLLAEKIRRFLD